MIRFTSTRGHGPVSFTEALFQGLAPDGGLYVPEGMPPLGRHGPLASLRGTTSTETGMAASFSDTALRMAKHLLGREIPEPALERIVGRALDFEVPLVRVEGDTRVLELFHGPSHAFKDVGARFMAHAMAELNPDPNLPRTVLVATSGDTGSAVARAFHGIEPYRVVVLYPHGGVSERQRKQMTTLGGNVTAVAVAGTFDDCQQMAKAAFADRPLARACGLTSANSINVGRLIPQCFYYVHAARMLGWDADPATFVVPSGNLGNLTAGLMARDLGMPTLGFIAALNANRAFLDYLETGEAVPRPSVPTVSNAMDVGVPSNLERIRALYGDAHDRVRSAVEATSVNDEDTRDCIRHVHERTGYLLDPHTAVAYRTAEKLRPRRTVVLATAHPGKFPDVVMDAAGVSPPLPPALAAALAAREHVTRLDADHARLREFLLDGIS